VVDSFGQKTKIRSVSNSRYLASWNNGSFFSLDKINKPSYEAPDNSLFYPPVIAKALNGKTPEEIYFIWDEMVNIVWAIETIVPSAIGRVIPRKENANEESKRDKGSKLKYIEQTAIPKNWIAFVPILLKDNKSILRRGGIEKIRPVTSILRPGLRPDKAWERNYAIEENEVG
jgi:hypothetical protein